MVVARREVDHREVQRVSGLGFRGAGTALEDGFDVAHTHFQGDGGVVCEGFLEVSVRLDHGRVDLFTEFLGRGVCGV